MIKIRRDKRVTTATATDQRWRRRRRRKQRVQFVAGYDRRDHEVDRRRR